MHLLLMTTLILAASTAQAAWKVDGSLQPMLYTHTQSGGLANVKGTSLALASIQAGVHYRRGDWQAELSHARASFNLNVEGDANSAQLLRNGLLIRWDKVFVEYHQSQNPLVIEQTPTELERLTSTWLGAGMRFDLPWTYWRAGGGIASQMSADITSYSVKSSSGIKLTGWVEYWQRLGDRKTPWNLNLKLFYESSTQSLKIKETTDKTKLSVEMLGLRIGLSYLF